MLLITHTVTENLIEGAPVHTSALLRVLFCWARKHRTRRGWKIYSNSSIVDKAMRGVLKRCARKSQAKTGRFMKREMISGQDLISSSDSRATGTGVCETGTSERERFLSRF